MPPEDAYAIKRRAPRSKTHLAVTLITREGENRAETPAQVVDFSRYGLTISSNVSLALGQQVDIVPNEGPDYVVACRVVWIRKSENGPGGRASLEFSKPLMPID